MPRSPCSTAADQRKNCTGSGSSSPSCWRMPAICSARRVVARDDRRRIAGREMQQQEHEHADDGHDEHGRGKRGDAEVALSAPRASQRRRSTGWGSWARARRMPAIAAGDGVSPAMISPGYATQLCYRALRPRPLPSGIVEASRPDAGGVTPAFSMFQKATTSGMPMTPVTFLRQAELRKNWPRMTCGT